MSQVDITTRQIVGDPKEFRRLPAQPVDSLYRSAHRSLATVGISLVVIAIFVPWLFLREPLALLPVDSSALSRLPLDDQFVPYLRMALLARIYAILPWFAAIAAIVGATLAGCGFFNVAHMAGTRGPE